MSSSKGRRVIHSGQYRMIEEESHAEALLRQAGVRVDGSNYDSPTLGGQPSYVRSNTPYTVGGTPAQPEEPLLPAAGPSEAERREAAHSAATTALAESLLTQARAEAERILSDAFRQAKALTQQAEIEGQQRGYEAGKAAAQAQVEAETRDGINRLHELLDNTRMERDQILARSEGDLVELAMAIARKVIGDAIAKDADVLVQIAQRAVEQLGQAGPFRLHLHPEDVARLSGRWPTGSQPVWELVGDERIAPGGCIVTCGASTIDARAETQLALIQNAFKGL
jgi:flagellar assembly protein FliH